MALLLWLGGVLVVVEGASECPSAQRVAERLRAYLPEVGAEIASDRARIDPVGAGIQIELRSPTGALLGQRRLDARASCEDLAGAAAVVIAAWEAELRPGIVPPPLLPRPPTLEPPRPPEPVTVPAPSPKPAPPVESAPRERPQRRPPPPVRVAVDAGAFVSFSGTLAPGAALGATLSRGLNPLAVRLGVSSTLPREESLGPGRFWWVRPRFTVGLEWRHAQGRWRLGVHANALAALLLVGGIGYERTLGDTDADPGLGGGVRAGVRLGPVTLSLDASIVWWLRPQEIRVAGWTGVAELPRVELLLGGTISVGADS